MSFFIALCIGAFIGGLAMMFALWIYMVGSFIRWW